MHEYVRIIDMNKIVRLTPGYFKGVVQNHAIGRIRNWWSTIKLAVSNVAQDIADAANICTGPCGNN